MSLIELDFEMFTKIICKIIINLSKKRFNILDQELKKTNKYFNKKDWK